MICRLSVQFPVTHKTIATKMDTPLMVNVSVPLDLQGKTVVVVAKLDGIIIKNLVPKGVLMVLFFLFLIIYV